MGDQILQRLGQASHLSSSRNLIIKIKQIPQIGEIVVDENLKSVGKVVDVFGPVSSPYASIKPMVKEPEKLLKKNVVCDPLKKKKGEG